MTHNPEDAEFAKLRDGELLDELRAIGLTHEDDPEARHIEADKVLLEALREAGFTRSVELFSFWKKWYG